MLRRSTNLANLVHANYLPIVRAILLLLAACTNADRILIVPSTTTSSMNLAMRALQPSVIQLARAQRIGHTVTKRPGPPAANLMFC